MAAAGLCFEKNRLVAVGCFLKLLFETKRVSLGVQDGGR